MNDKESCYKCGQSVSSREHVPPLCFFPEKKDTNNFDFRKDLITVPSCDEHNSKKSMDDEFLMACLTGIVENNAIGYFHNKTKVKRALERKNRHFIKSIFKDPKAFLIHTDKGDFPLIQGSPHYERMVKCFEHIAYGLFYHEFKQVFDGECRVFLGFLKYHDENMEKTKTLIRKLYDIESVDWTFKGKNPSVFRYQFGTPDQFGLIPLKFTFYEGTEIFVAFKPKDKQFPSDFAMKLITSGVKTIVRLSDGDAVEFN